MADELGASRDRIRGLKVLAVDAAARVAAGRPGFGMLIDGTYGREALFRAADQPFWIGRPVELPGSRPLDIDGGGSLAAKLIEWPVEHCVKCLCFMRPDDPADLRDRQERELLRLQDASRTVGRELLVEIISGKHGSLADDTVARVIDRLYAIGIRPDWWKLEGQPSAAAWANVAETIREHDPLCRGIMLLGLDAPLEVLGGQFRLAAGCDLVRGFAVGRSIFGEPARAWLGGTLTDDEVVARMAERFRGLVDIWSGLRPDATAA